MKSFLEFVCRRLLGYPSGGQFVCPFCAKQRLVVRDTGKFKCFGCDAWGDEIDLVKQVHGIRYPTARQHVAEMRSEYEESPTAVPAAGMSSPRRDGGTLPPEQYKVEACRERLLDAAGLPDTPELLGELKYMREVFRLAEECGVTEVWAVIEILNLLVRVEEHLAECRDPDCENACCRLRRGWTQEDIDAAIAEDKATSAERRQWREERRAIARGDW
jgi:hypothetical protein